MTGVVHEYDCGHAAHIRTSMPPTHCPRCGERWVGAWTGDDRPSIFADREVGR